MNTSIKYFWLQDVTKYFKKNEKMEFFHEKLLP